MWEPPTGNLLVVTAAICFPLFFLPAFLTFRIWILGHGFLVQAGEEEEGLQFEIFPGALSCIKSEVTSEEGRDIMRVII